MLRSRRVDRGHRAVSGAPRQPVDVQQHDLKNSNNTLYEHRMGDRAEWWFVVRDLGSALGSTGRFAPVRGNPDVFARQRFITGVRNGFVAFEYRGWHQELLRRA